MTVDAVVQAFNGANGIGPTVCVTGADGFIFSWLVKLLLEKGYTVKRTVRNPDDPKNAPLKTMKGAAERLILCKADLLDFAALRQAIDGCQGVFHTASPVTDDPEQMEDPAVRGTKHVINAAADAGTARPVVSTSSVGAVTADRNRGPDVVVDESCWSDLDYSKNTGNWYCYGKAAAERAAWVAAKERGVELAVVIPVLVMRPFLQPTLNASAMHVTKYLDGSTKKYANAVQGYMDVREVEEAHARVFEAQGAAGKRFLCAERVLHRGDLVLILARLFPQYPVPNNFVEGGRFV